MEELPKISVITIVFNGANSIQRTIDSVVEQEYPHSEYIVVDGGSKDGTLEILKRNDDRIDHWISEKDEGISDAFNKGVELASGELIGILNADDQYTPNALFEVGKAFSEDGVYYGNMQMMEDGKAGETFIPNHLLLEKDMTLCHPSCFISKSIYEEHGLYRKDFRLAMDYELLLRLKKTAVRFVHIDHSLTRMSDNGASDVHWKEAFKEVQKARKIHLKTGLADDLKANLVQWRRTLGRAMDKGPLRPVVGAYRRWFSLVRKK